MLGRVDGNLQTFFDCLPPSQAVLVALNYLDVSTKLLLDKPVTIEPKNGSVFVACPTHGAEGGIKIRSSI